MLIYLSKYYQPWQKNSDSPPLEDGPHHPCKTSLLGFLQGRWWVGGGAVLHWVIPHQACTPIVGTPFTKSLLDSPR